MDRSGVLLFLCCAMLAATGCTTMKESHTARTGIEQLLISSATDRALNKIDFRPIAGAKVLLETKYLECVDKNYVIVALRRHLMANNCTLVDKADDAQVVLEVASGGVGTDGTETYVGMPEIPLPPPSPVSIPKLPLLQRNRSIGTAKLAVVAYDAGSKRPVLNSGFVLARADHKTWTVLGVGGITSGTVHDELLQHTGDVESMTGLATEVAFLPSAATHVAAEEGGTRINADQR